MGVMINKYKKFYSPRRRLITNDKKKSLKHITLKKFKTLEYLIPKN